MDSPLHRRNLLDPDYNVVGVGILRRGGNIYVTEDFARRLSEYSEPQAEAALQSAIEHYVRSVGLQVPARKPEPRLRHMACDMALNDALNNQAAAQLPGAHEVMVWTAGDPGKLSDQVKKRLSQAVPSGYALGACFAPSVSHPGGLYWLVMLPVSPWVVRVFDALHTHLYCCSALVAGGFSTTAITRPVDWTEFIAAEPHGLPLPGHFVKAVGLSEKSELEKAAPPSGCYNACPRGSMPNLTGVVRQLREGNKAGR